MITVSQSVRAYVTDIDGTMPNDPELFDRLLCDLLSNGIVYLPVSARPSEKLFSSMKQNTLVRLAEEYQKVTGEPAIIGIGFDGGVIVKRGVNSTHIELPSPMGDEGFKMIKRVLDHPEFRDCIDGIASPTLDGTQISIFSNWYYQLLNKNPSPITYKPVSVEDYLSDPVVNAQVGCYTLIINPNDNPSTIDKMIVAIISDGYEVYIGDFPGGRKTLNILNRGVNKGSVAKYVLEASNLVPAAVAGDTLVTTMPSGATYTGNDRPLILMPGYHARIMVGPQMDFILANTFEYWVEILGGDSRAVRIVSSLINRVDISKIITHVRTPEELPAALRGILAQLEV